MGLEMAIHHFDLVRAIFDANALSGQVQEWNPSRSPYHMGGALEALFTMGSPEFSFPFLYFRESRHPRNENTVGRNMEIRVRRRHGHR